jgi:alpha-beta hydrolase superfamily lysophospholipase
MRIPFLAAFCAAALTLGAFGAVSDPRASVRSSIQAELEDFSQPDWNRKPATWTAEHVFAPEAPPALTEYRKRMIREAGWKDGPIWHQAGTLPWTSREGVAGKLGVNVFFPLGTSKGTLLFVHGYLSHAVNFAYTYAYFLARGYSVVTLDLPGHGLSTGPRGDIGSFAEYGDAAAIWMKWVWKQNWPGPKILMAHSLGTAACFDALGRADTPRPDKIVFFAPLLRPVWYPVLALGDALAGWAFRDLPSQFGWDGFLDGTSMPIHWFEALRVWLDGLEKRRPEALPLTIYAGGHDDVVDSGWNVAEYRRLVPGVRIVELPAMGHLFVSSKSDRVAFHTRLWADLGLE